MSALEFLSASRCDPAAIESPLRRALANVSSVKDRSLDGKVELRGDVALVRIEEGEELVRLSPRRGFLLTPRDPADVALRVRAHGVLAYDATGAWAGIELEGEQLMRRLTDLDLDALPAAGPFARVPAIVVRDEGERFRVFIAQELGHDVALAVVDAISGLESNA